MTTPRAGDAEDQEAIRAVLAGDREAFRSLVEKYSRSILNLGYRMTGNAADAEDLTQESFLKAYARLGEFRLGARFHPWLYTIALNLCRTQLRRKALLQWRSSAPSGEGDGVTVAEPRESAPDPERRLLEREADRRLQDAVRALPAKYREVFVLRQAQGLRYEEIAELLGLPLGTVEARLFRARRRVLESLQSSGLGAGRGK